MRQGFPADLKTMFRLCRKDLLSSWIFLAVVSAFSLFNAPIFFRLHTAAYPFLAGGVILLSLFIVLGLEDKYRTDLILCSLPLRRRMIVSGRYLFSFLAVLSGGALFYAIAYGLQLFSAAGEAKPPWLSVEGGLSFFLIVMIAPALFLPFYYRFGFGRGLAAFVLGILALLIVSAVVETLTALPAATAAGNPSRALPFATGRHLFGGLLQVRQVIGADGFVGLLAVVAAALEFLSVRLSARFYGRRDL